MAAGDQKDYRSPGEILRESREERGLSVEDVAEATKISPRMLYALEADEYEELAGPLYARSFLRTLSRYFSLDEPDMFERLESLDAEASRPQIPVHLDRADEPSAPSIPQPATSMPEEKIPSTWRVETVDSTQVKHIQAESSGGRVRILGIVLLLAVLAVAAWYFLSGGAENGNSSSPEGLGQAEARPEEHLFAGGPQDQVPGGDDEAQEAETQAATTLAGETQEPAEALTPTTQPKSSPPSSPPEENSGDESSQPEDPVTRDTGSQDVLPTEEAESPAPTLTEQSSAQVPAQSPEQSTEERSDELAEAEDSGGSGALGSIMRPGVEPPVAGEIRLELRALEETEIWFAVDGGNRQRRRLAAGEVLQLTAQDHFEVEFDDPEAITVLVDGESRPVPPNPHLGWVIYPDN